MKLGEKIRHIRQLKDFSQQNMADLLEVSLNTYAAVEQNKTDITLSRLEKIASVFEMSVEELIAFGAANHFHAHNNSGGFNANYIENVSVSDKLEQRLLHLETKFAAIERQLEIIIQNLTR